jgi:hypothetical protein
VRNLVSGIIGLAWGGLILLGFLVRGLDPEASSAYRAGQVTALVMGVLFFLGGGVYLVLGLRELWPEPPKRKRRRRRDDDYYDENRPPRRRSRRDGDD